MEIKVLRVITWLPRGGIEKRLLKLLPMLKEKGVDIEVACIREWGSLAPQLAAAGVKVHLIPFRTRLDPRSLFKLGRFIKGNKFNIVHSHMYGSNVPATIAAHFAGVPVIISQVHNIDTWQGWRQLWQDRWLNRWRQAVVAVSEQVRHELLYKLKVPAEKCSLIYNGIDVEEFERIHESKQELRAEIGLKAEDVVITTAARLVPQKNHQGIIEAAKQLVADFPNLTFLLVGTGKLRPQLEEEIGRLKISRYISFLGHREDMPRILKASDIFLLPSFKEGFSNAILEAMAAGLPVVASKVGGNPEAVQETQTGFLVSPQNATELVAKLRQLISNIELRRRMGEKARERVRLFSLEKMMENTLTLYQKLLAQAKKTL